MYDLVIIGAGPAGLSAGLYAGRAKLNTLILEKDSNGGQIVTTESIENYPGSVGEESGPSLIKRMVEQVKNFHVEIRKDGVKDVELEGEVKKLTLESGDVVETKTVIIATGANNKKLGCPGEREFTGKGVSYCATCDADFFTDFEVFVVGGGNSAVEEATYLTKFARKVTLLVRKDKLKCDAVAKERAEAAEGLSIRYNTSIKELQGEGLLNKMVLVDNVTGEESVYEADEDDGLFGVFVFIGQYPITEVFEGKIELNAQKYIPTDENMHTNIEGVYAAGDVRVKDLRQVVTACADGAIAATQAEKYIDSLK